MGCIQSIRCKPKSFRDSVIVLEVNSSIDPNPTSIDESSSVVLRYRTPHFRASARVLVPPVAGKETWTIGWIQACNHMEFYNTYGNKGMWVPPCCLVDPVTKLAGLESRIQHFCTSWRVAVFSTVIWYLAVCLRALKLWRTSQIWERGIKMERSDLSARTRQVFFSTAAIKSKTKSLFFPPLLFYSSCLVSDSILHPIEGRQELSLRYTLSADTTAEDVWVLCVYD